MNAARGLRDSEYTHRELQLGDSSDPWQWVLLGGCIAFIIWCLCWTEYIRRYCEQSEKREKVLAQDRARAYAQICEIEGTKVYMNPELFGYPPHDTSKDTYTTVNEESGTNSPVTNLMTINDPFGFAVVSENLVTILEFRPHKSDAGVIKSEFSYNADDLLQHRVFIKKDIEAVVFNDPQRAWVMLIGLQEIRFSYGFLNSLLNSMCFANNIDPSTVSNVTSLATVIPFQGETPVASLVKDKCAYDE